MKIIFLDIDGVLNSLKYDCNRGETDGNIDKSRLILLKTLISQTDAKIVLTSSWRSHWDPNGENIDEIGKELENVFLECEIKLFDKTPRIDNNRKEEIKAWLKEHNDVDSFVILDDIKFGWEDLETNVVKTDYRIGKGLETHHVEKAIKILSKAK